MLRNHLIDRICCIVLAITLLLTCILTGAASMGLAEGSRSIGYENRLFDQARVHTIDIVMDDWDGFLQTCTDEQYVACDVVIDGEHYSNVGIRAKGNTSLSSVQQFGNDRYSFKIEFDHYQNGRSYHGLDKLSLNNLIQDKTYLKDYLAYTLMKRMNAAAPLCSFAQINVNGKPWGLYLAVEAVEDSFLLRNYGVDHGELYKPDSLSFGGGGPGRGMDFDMEEVQTFFNRVDGEKMDVAQDSPPFPNSDGEFAPPDMSSFSPDAIPDMSDFASGTMPDMGDSDVKLQYIDDNPASYENIFSSAKTDVSEADQQRLIASLKALSEGIDIESVVDAEAVTRYLVVHNFLCNDDSYTGMMVHNYYLYEKDGKLSMLPWDYNLALGGFSMGGFGGGEGATSVVNSPIDSPVSGGELSSRPMVAWIFQSEAYTERYHQLYAEFIAYTFENGWFLEEVERVSTLIAPYVQKETNAFFTYEEFEAGVDTLQKFCTLRATSVLGQLEGEVPSTSEEQQADSGALLDASHINLSDMGEFGMGGGAGGFPKMPAFSRQADVTSYEETPGNTVSSGKMKGMEPLTETPYATNWAAMEETDIAPASMSGMPQAKDNFSPQSMKDEVLSRNNPDAANSSISNDDLLLLMLSSVGLLCAIAFAVRWQNSR